MKAHESMICWTPNTHEIELLPWPDTERLSDRYDCTWGACNSFLHKCSGKQLAIVLAIKALQLVSEYDMPPKKVMNVFMEIDEFRDALEEVVNIELSV
jgi:hypothetical protein